MLHVTLRGLQGHLVRLLLTASAVMLGVSFVTGTFVLRDSIDNTLAGLVARRPSGATCRPCAVRRRSCRRLRRRATGARPPVPLDPGPDTAAPSPVSRGSCPTCRARR